MKKVIWHKSARKKLLSLPKNQQKFIYEKVEQFLVQGEPTNQITPLRGTDNGYRLRVGDWRVLYTDDGHIIGIYKVAPRGSAYD